LQRVPPSYEFVRWAYLFNAGDSDCHKYKDLGSRLIARNPIDRAVAWHCRAVRLRAARRPHSASDWKMASTRAVTAASPSMQRPHSRLVSPGHLLVASSPILLPSPLTGEAKSR